MGIRFLGTPIEQFDQLCNEEEIVMIHVSTFKMEPLWHPADGNVTQERVQTGGWGVQIKSSKDIYQFDNESPRTRNTLSDEIREKLR